MRATSQLNVSKSEPLARLENAYAEKQADYFECVRPEMLKLFPAGANRILDIGCGSGVFGQSLKKTFGCEVWGVEPDLKSSEKATARLDHVVHGYFDEKTGLPSGYFDCIFFNDVLEHMIDPAFALRLSKIFLAPAGKIVASIPNIAHFPTVWRLVARGQWEYTERGTLDRTHLRFFTRQSIRRLFEDAGFLIKLLEGINEFAEMQPGDGRLWKIYRIFSWLPHRHLRDMAYLQFGVVAGLQQRP
jgi:SAM-dependent methyltransferase